MKEGAVLFINIFKLALKMTSVKFFQFIKPYGIGIALCIQSNEIPQKHYAYSYDTYNVTPV